MNDIDRRIAEREIDLSALEPEQQERWRRRLEQLPPGIRDSLRKNLQRLPADRVAQILRGNEPMVAKLESRLGSVAEVAASAKAALPHRVHQFDAKGHYSNTVQRGDHPSLPLLPLIALAAAAALLLDWLLGG